MSTYTKFTNGPWLIAGDGRFVYALNDRGVNAFCAHVMDAHTSDAELRANASLIARAPNMYEVLERALSWADQWLGEGPKWVEEARAELAKARGENE